LNPQQPYTSRSLALQETRPSASNPGFRDTSGVKDVDIHGLIGAIYSESRTVAFGVGLTSTNVFIAQPNCAWEIRFTSGASIGRPEDYRTLFGRMVSTFKPTP
jgi:hypothetical protein